MAIFPSLGSSVSGSISGFPTLNSAVSNLAQNVLTTGAEKLISSIVGSDDGGWGIYTSTSALMNGSFVDTATSIALSLPIAGKTLGDWIGGDPTDYFDAPDFTSMHSVNSRRESSVLDHPIEGGAFMTYNKVKTPDSCQIQLTRSGHKTKRTEFLAWLDKHSRMTSVFDIVTPEKVYKNMTLESYELDRQAENGGTSMIMANCSFREVIVVSVNYGMKEKEGSTIDCISSNDSPMTVLKKASAYIDENIDSAVESVKKFFNPATPDNKDSNGIESSANKVDGSSEEQKKETTQKVTKTSVKKSVSPKRASTAKYSAGNAGGGGGVGGWGDDAPSNTWDNWISGMTGALAS